MWYLETSPASSTPSRGNTFQTSSEARLGPLERARGRAREPHLKGTASRGGSCASAPVERSRWPGLGWRPALVVMLVVGLLVAGLIRGLSRPAPAPPPDQAVSAVKITVEADGIYEIKDDALRAIGFDLDALAPEELSLSSGGQPIGFQVVDQEGERALRFYGQALGATAYTDVNVYWLARQSPPSSSSRMTTEIKARSAALPPGVDPATVISATVHVEEQRQYVPKVGVGDDRWLWQSLFAPGQIAVSVATPHLVNGEATLRLRVWGNSSAPANPDHHLVVTSNAATVVDAAWDGMGAHVITATVPAGVLNSGDNQLLLRAPGDTGAQADAVLLDWAEITYARELTMAGEDLTFDGAATGYAVRITDEPAALWDITDAARPVALVGYQVDANTLRFGSDGTLRRFILASAAGLRKPAALTPVADFDLFVSSPQTLRDRPGGADEIIVTAPQFRDALQPLVEARQAAGLRVAVVDLTAVYDTFAYGRTDPAAIRALVQQARSGWAPPAPRYLLLAGDASYDPQGHLAGPERDLVPTQLIDTAFTGWTASDVWFALPDDAPGALPVLAVGRFPAQTPAQMAAMVAKTLDYERDDPTAPWRGAALIVADNDDPGFAAAAEAFAAALSDDRATVLTVIGDGSEVRADLLRAFDDGIGLVGYFGHGSLNLWAQERVFSVEDVARLSNRDRLPLVFTLTCLSGFFEHPTTPSLGEILLRAENGGAVAALVPSSAALLSDQRLLADGLAHALADRQQGGAVTVGDLIYQAQAGLMDRSPGVREVLLTFNLLGDPALTIPH